VSSGATSSQARLPTQSEQSVQCAVTHLSAFCGRRTQSEFRRTTSTAHDDACPLGSDGAPALKSAKVSSSIDVHVLCVNRQLGGAALQHSPDPRALCDVFGSGRSSRQGGVGFSWVSRAPRSPAMRGAAPIADNAELIGLLACDAAVLAVLCADRRGSDLCCCGDGQGEDHVIPASRAGAARSVIDRFARARTRADLRTY
jgi:hypothetical protein